MSLWHLVVIVISERGSGTYGEVLKKNVVEDRRPMGIKKTKRVKKSVKVVKLIVKEMKVDNSAVERFLASRYAFQ